MATETIDHTTLQRLIESGAVNNARVIGTPGGWSIQVKCGASSPALIAQRSRNIRLFRKLETLVGYLKDIGINEFDVDATSYQPSTHSRPDRSEAMKLAHQAAAQDAWFRDQVQAALEDPRPPVSHADAKALFARRRKAILKGT